MLDEEVISSVAIGNLKAISEQPAMLSNLAYLNVVSTNNLGQQNAVANQQAVNELGISVVAKGSNTVSNLDPMTARSAVDILTNDEMAQTIADMKSVLQAFGGADKHGGGGSGLLRKLKALLDLGIRVDGQGRIVIPPGVAVVVPGKFSKENIKITIDHHGIVFEVIPLLQ